jgi:hypothetical protein
MRYRDKSIAIAPDREHGPAVADAPAMKRLTAATCGYHRSRALARAGRQPGGARCYALDELGLGCCAIGDHRQVARGNREPA